MLFSTTIFPKLDDYMRKANMSRKNLSVEADISYDTLGNKLRGDTDFTRIEMYRIKNILEKKLTAHIFLDDLFTTSS